MRPPRRQRVLLIALVLAFAVTRAPAAPTDWISVDYSELVDRRQLSHSGESVGALLERLDGRPLPPPGERANDRHAHGLLEPLLEPYGFVLTDALDRLDSATGPPWIEVGSLWQPGEPQPAWVELLRARRYVVESNGAGRLRAVVPLAHDPSDQGLPAVEGPMAARTAWQAAWPIVRHVLAAEARRLQRPGSDPATVTVEVHAYRHLPERSIFQLATAGETITIEDTRGDGLGPPVDLEGIRAFLESGLRLEGARLEGDGRLRLLGSRAAAPPTLLGAPIDLADFAVAYRAVFHGGLAEPYMSLDRGFSPMRSIVNYGGRLRDTALGMVSLLCDIRFKTFSLGIDIAEGTDLRERLRSRLPGFRTHLEHLAADPQSQGMAGQQTRLWFYPDEVDLTLSEQGDVLVMRSVRMSAASERLGETGLAVRDQDVRPWTRATVEAINEHYDTLAAFFDEMADLDQVVRLLSLFAWLKQAGEEGLVLPELEGLMALELPALATPRTYPQLLAFNALPPPGGAQGVTVYDRVGAGEALDRLNPSNGRPLPARRRYQRAVGALDPERPEHARLLKELGGYDVEKLADSELDLLAQRAERLRMHQTVLGTLEMSRRRELGERLRRGEDLRMFSVGIGGLDLGMGPVVERARGRRVGLAGGGSALAAASSGPGRPGAGRAAGREVREQWRIDPDGLPATVLPDHGLEHEGSAGPASASYGQHEVSRGVFTREESRKRWVLTVYGVDGPEVRSRRVVLDGKGLAEVFERTEEQRTIRYRLEGEGSALRARITESTGEPPRPSAPTGRELPAGLALLHLTTPAGGRIESPAIALRLESWSGGTARNLEAEFPRAQLQRLVRGRELDATPDQPLPGLSPLPPSLGAVHTLMVQPGEDLWRSPWEGERPLLAGEEDPLRMARALGAWWASSGPDAPAAVVGVDPARSAERWALAPRPDGNALLLLPEDGFSGPVAGWRAPLAESWGGRPVATSLSDESRASLVVLVSGDPPGRFASRLRELARDDRMRGRLLAAWSLAGPVREDLARSLLDEGILSGVGIAEDALVARRHAVDSLAQLAGLLAGPESDRRVEQLGGPFLWHF